MNITFFGAVRTTTGSMHLLEINDTRILLECGVFQGKRKEAFERNRNLPFDPASIDKVLLSHAHIDHNGNLPTLVKRGFRGEILATPATRDLCDIMLRDSAYLQEKDVQYANKQRKLQGKTPFEPLYVPGDIDETMGHFRDVPYGIEFDIAPGARATFHDAGHLLGSAITTIDFSENGSRRRLLFTGDLGRKNMPILRDPTVVKNVDILITESTYGDRLHPPKADIQGRLKAFIEDIHMQRAKLIIPSFSVGRTQEIVYFLNEIHEQGRIAEVPIFVDSPLSSKATEVYEKHSECYDRQAIRGLLEGDKPFHFRGLKYTTTTEESKKLNDMPGPAIIISSSGMCEGGRIVHHLANNIQDPRNIILFIGYQAKETLGRRIVEHVSPIRIFGKEYEVKARIHTINALSAHADRNELFNYFVEMGPQVQKAFVVHGESKQSDALAAGLLELGAQEAIVPQEGERINA